MEVQLRLKFELIGQPTRSKSDDAFPVIGPLSWDIRKGFNITLGRHEENKIQPNSMIFRSKVVSRKHAEIWQGEDDKVYIKDMGSSSGTFLNMERLSAANTISEPMELNDGDIIRIGSNYHGGLLEKYRFTTLRIHIYCLSEWNKYFIEDCCICLFGITSGQAIFVAPCHHIFHYICCRPLLVTTDFLCPLCREKKRLNLD